MLPWAQAAGMHRITAAAAMAARPIRPHSVPRYRLTRLRRISPVSLLESDSTDRAVGVVVMVCKS